MRHRLAFALTVCLLMVPLVGCLGPDDPAGGTGTNSTNQTDTNETGSADLPETLSGLTNVSSVKTDGSGTGIWIDEARDILLSANGNAGLQLFDVSDPTAPQRLGSLAEVPQPDDEPLQIYARDVDLMEWGNQSLAILAAGDGIHVVDITDPMNPELVVTADAYSSHNVAVVPGTPYVYDATAVGIEQKVTDAIIPVLDLSNLTEPEWTTIPIPPQVNGVATQSDGCHDIVVRQDLERAYCAGGGSMYQRGGGESFIWDISGDPLSPEWLGVVDNPSIIYHHQAVASEDGDLLFINDENIAPNCQRISEDPITAGQTTAAMWVYDISDPMTPILQGYLQAESPEATPDPEGNCGSHFGDLIDGREALSWGWYEGGILLVDVSDPMNPTILDQEAPIGATWDARYHDGHVYGSSGDLQIFQIE